MKEITMIANVQVTKIFKNVPDCFEMDKDGAEEMIKRMAKEGFDADDVQVKEIQQFILEK